MLFCGLRSPTSVINLLLMKTINKRSRGSELRCIFGGRSIVPDIAVFTWEHIPRDQNGEVANTFTLPPNWTIEILSPEQNQTNNAPFLT